MHNHKIYLKPIIWDKWYIRGYMNEQAKFKYAQTMVRVLYKGR